MKLPISFTTVTKTSKILALTLFITLPLLGFYLGTRYQETITPKQADNTSVNKPASKTDGPSDLKSQLNPYSTAQYSFQYPKGWVISEEKENSLILKKTDKANIEGTLQDAEVTISFSKEKVSPELTLGQWFENEYKANSAFDVISNLKKETTLGGIKAIEVFEPGAAGYIDQGVMAIHQGNGYKIMIRGIEIAGSLKDYRSIIESFKFPTIPTLK
jgi:hypothetical protein